MKVAAAASKLVTDMCAACHDGMCMCRMHAWRQHAGAAPRVLAGFKVAARLTKDACMGCCSAEAALQLAAAAGRSM